MALLTAKELAAELRLTPKQVRRLARTGKIPAMRFASEWRFDVEAVRKAATYLDPMAASAHRAARKVWTSFPRRGA